MTTPTPESVKALADGLTRSQRTLILALDETWKYPRQIIPQGTSAQMSHRDPALVERLSEASGHPYRLTPLGLAVRAHLGASHA